MKHSRSASRHVASRRLDAGAATCLPARRRARDRVSPRGNNGGCTIVALVLRHYHHTGTRHIDDVHAEGCGARSCIFTRWRRRWRYIDGSCPRNDSEPHAPSSSSRAGRRGVWWIPRRGATTPPPPPSAKEVEETWLGCIAQDVGALAPRRPAGRVRQASRLAGRQAGKAGRQAGRSLLLGARAFPLRSATQSHAARRTVPEEACASKRIDQIIIHYPRVPRSSLQRRVSLQPAFFCRRILPFVEVAPRHIVSRRAAPLRVAFRTASTFLSFLRDRAKERLTRAGDLTRRVRCRRRRRGPLDRRDARGIHKEGRRG